jgi:hypothetical protein
MQGLHCSMGVFIRLSVSLPFHASSLERAIRPHIASRISNVLSINHHKRFLVLKIQSVGPLLDRDDIDYAPIPENPVPERFNHLATAYRYAIPMAQG